MNSIRDIKFWKIDESRENREKSRNCIANIPQPILRFELGNTLLVPTALPRIKNNIGIDISKVNKKIKKHNLLSDT